MLEQRRDQVDGLIDSRQSARDCDALRAVCGPCVPLAGFIVPGAPVVMGWSTVVAADENEGGSQGW